MVKLFERIRPRGFSPRKNSTVLESEKNGTTIRDKKKERKKIYFRSFEHDEGVHKETHIF